MNHLTGRDFALVQAIMRAAPAGASLTKLAGLLGASPSLLSRNLKPLVETGWVRREVLSTPAGREVHYSAGRGVDVRWLDGDSGIALAWVAPDIDWEFPLVSRIADADARASIVSYLRALRDASILDAPRRTTPAKDDRIMIDHLGTAVIGIGSAVTNRMDRSSDVDLVVVLSERQGIDLAEQAEEIAADVSLATPRAVQVRARSIDDIMDADDVISSAVRQFGIVLYDSLRKPSGGKDVSILRRIEGRRG